MLSLQCENLLNHNWTYKKGYHIAAWSEKIMTNNVLEGKSRQGTVTGARMARILPVVLFVLANMTAGFGQVLTIDGSGNVVMQGTISSNGGLISSTGSAGAGRLQLSQGLSPTPR